MDFKKAVQGTLLEEVYEVLEKGVFAPAPNEPVKENEKVLLKGLRGFEKAILTVTVAIDDEYDSAVKKSKATGKPVDSKTEARLEESTKILIPFFWNCVRRRIKPELEGSSALKIRAGYKIVLRPLYDVQLILTDQDNCFHTRSC